MAAEDHDAASGPPGARPGVSQAGSHKALLIVCLVMVIDLLGFGIVLPLLPRYGREFLDPLLPADTKSWRYGLILGLLLSSFSLMQFVFAPIWGRLSDRLGRRPFLILGLVGSVLFYALFGFASDWAARTGQLGLGLGLLFVARIGAGIAGATVSTAQSVIADCTTKERRGRGMALIGAAFGVGFTGGPVIGAFALRYYPDYRGLPGYIAAAISLAALILAVILMPETLRPGAFDRERSWFNSSSFRLAFRTPTVGTLISTFFLTTLAFASFEPTLAFLTQDVLNYGNEDNFWIFAYVGMVLLIAQGGLYQMLARKGLTEIQFILSGGTFMGAGLAGLGCSAWLVSLQAAVSAGMLLFLFMGATTIAVIGFAFVTPSVQALISRRSDPSRQGEILGVNQSANAMSRILGPMAGTILYHAHASHTFPYVTSVALLVVALALVWQVRYYQPPGSSVIPPG